ncbi:putative YkwD family protein [Salirhabdus euzebyi]|uniref:Putative YkwD family protein n=1 Tax=Salirhabdus euzebyi TaxID=394506 RepID=A0A841Q285_9BACI|nr:CAP domain-containing protein [Salirhabdus euzebyi]MBB6452753.1 putative YkwD family protein [Salirhabdus euzebyi]
MKNRWLIILVVPLLIALFFYGATYIANSIKEAADSEKMVVSDHGIKNVIVKDMPADIHSDIRFVKEKEEERLRLEQERLEQERIKKEEEERFRLEEAKRKEEEQKRAEAKKQEEEKQQENETTQEPEEPVKETKQKWNYPGISSFEREVVKYTNIERGKHGLPELQIDSKLSEVAWYKSKDMVVNNYFDHQSPTYGSPFEMLTYFGVGYTAAAENIAMGYRSAEGVVNGWMNSEGHRRNILNGTYTHIGVGFVQDSYTSTQMFLRK